MANMSPYTAYDDAPESVSVINDVLLAPFKPSTQLWMYGHMPSLWSGSKGVHIPVDLSSVKRTAAAVKGAFKNKKYLGAAGEALKMPMALRPFGTGGSRILGQGNVNAQRALLSKFDRRTSRLRSVTGGRRFQYEMRTSIFKDIQTELDVLHYDTPIKKFQKPSVMNKLRLDRAGKVERLELQGSIARKRQLASGTKLNRSTRQLARYERRIGKLSTALTGKAATKFAMRGMKALSVIGAVGFAWDMAKMIGEPVGRAVVSQIDQAAQEWEDRFMPELGGRLEMTYLTRGAATDRQRAIQAMSKSQITGRSGFGQEASYAHR